MSVAVGEIVSLVKVWGTQRRQKCVICTKFFTGETCRHCGTRYEPVAGDQHRVVALP